MRLKRLGTLVLVGAMLVSSLAGCSKKPVTEDPNTTAETTTAPIATTAPAETTTPAEEAITADITVWSPAEDQSADYGEWLQTQCEAFAKEHPSWNITFKYGTCSEGDAGKTVTQDPSASADVYMFANDQLTSLIDAGAISQLGGTTADYVTSTNSAAIVNSVTVDGGIYGVPFTTNTWYMYYDKSVFTDEDVKSLDTMISKAKISFPITNSWYIASFYVANGCTFFGDGTDETKGIDFSGDKAVKVTDYLVDLVKNANFVSDAGGSGMAGLADGSIKAIFSGSWDFAAAKAALGDNLGIAALPTIKIDGADKQLKSFAGSKAIAVNPNCKYPQVAVALALYLGNADSQLSHYTARNIVPCNTELLAREEIQKDVLVKAQNATFDTTSILQPFVSAMGNYWSPAENFGNSIVNGEVTHDNAAEMTEALNKSLNTALVQ